MTIVSVVCHSGMGHTKEMAEAVAKGAGDVDGVQVNPTLGAHNQP